MKIVGKGMFKISKIERKAFLAKEKELNIRIDEQRVSI